MSQDGGVLDVERVAHQQSGALRGKAGLDPEVAPAAQLAGYQYSSGKRIVVTDLSAPGMTQTRPSPIP
jgi:hypothetical protein